MMTVGTWIEEGGGHASSVTLLILSLCSVCHCIMEATGKIGCYAMKTNLLQNQKIIANVLAVVNRKKTP